MSITNLPIAFGQYYHGKRHGKPGLTEQELVQERAELLRMIRDLNTEGLTFRSQAMQSYGDLYKNRVDALKASADAWAEYSRAQAEGSQARAMGLNAAQTRYALASALEFGVPDEETMKRAALAAGNARGGAFSTVSQNKAALSQAGAAYFDKDVAGKPTGAVNEDAAQSLADVVYSQFAAPVQDVRNLYSGLQPGSRINTIWQTSTTLEEAARMAVDDMVAAGVVPKEAAGDLVNRVQNQIRTETMRGIPETEIKQVADLHTLGTRVMHEEYLPTLHSLGAGSSKEMKVSTDKLIALEDEIAAAMREGSQPLSPAEFGAQAAQIPLPEDTKAAIDWAHKRLDALHDMQLPEVDRRILTMKAQPGFEAWASAMNFPSDYRAYLYARRHPHEYATAMRWASESPQDMLNPEKMRARMDAQREQEGTGGWTYTRLGRAVEAFHPQSRYEKGVAAAREADYQESEGDTLNAPPAQQTVITYESFGPSAQNPDGTRKYAATPGGGPPAKALIDASNEALRMGLTPEQTQSALDQVRSLYPTGQTAPPKPPEPSSSAAPPAPGKDEPTPLKQREEPAKEGGRAGRKDATVATAQPSVSEEMVEEIARGPQPRPQAPTGGGATGLGEALAAASRPVEVPLAEGEALAGAPGMTQKNAVGNSLARLLRRSSFPSPETPVGGSGRTV